MEQERYEEVQESPPSTAPQPDLLPSRLGSLESMEALDGQERQEILEGSSPFASPTTAVQDLVPHSPAPTLISNRERRKTQAKLAKEQMEALRALVDFKDEKALGLTIFKPE